MAAIERAREDAVEQTLDRLASAGVEAVALGFVDPAAIVRVKTIPLHRFPAAVRAGIGLSTVFAVALSNDEFTSVPGYVEGPSGDLRLVPDPGATVPLAAMPGWAWAPVDQLTQDGEVWGACPRSFLRRVSTALSDIGLEARVAFEYEFSLAREVAGEFVPVHHGPGYSDSVLVAHHELALDLIRAFEGQGLEVQQFHPEYTPGQFEVSIAPRRPLETADHSLILRQTVRAVAKRYGMRATFSPRTFGPVGNGMHLHLSVWRGDRNLLHDPQRSTGMTAEGEAFVAGILRELPALVAVTAPSPLSYLRLQPHHWSGATQCWGPENREAALRFVRGMVGTRGSAANVEVKPVDATCNPYLAMGAILAAGLAGVTERLELPPPTTEDPSALPPEERERRGVAGLPASLSEAIQRLAASQVLRAAMGDLLFETFLATRRGDEEQYRDVAEDEMVRQYLWRY